MIVKRCLVYWFGLFFDWGILIAAIYPICYAWKNLDYDTATFYTILTGFGIMIASVIWIPVCLIPAICKLAGKQKREDLALTLIRPSSYILQHLRRPVFRAMMTVLLAMLFTYMAILDKGRFSSANPKRLLGSIFLLNCASWILVLSGVFRIIALLCRMQSMATGKTIYSLLAVIVWSVIFAYLASYGLMFGICWFFDFDQLSVAEFINMTYPIVLLSVFIFWREWKKLCSVYFKFEDEDFRKVYDVCKKK